MAFHKGDAMDSTTAGFSLVERKKYDDKSAHQIAEGIWWVGFLDAESGDSHNPYLLVDQDEAVLVNPGSRAEKHHRIVSDKVSSIIDLSRIQHIVVLHHDPDRCAAITLFEKAAHRDVRIYAPSRVTNSIRHYGCKHPVVGLDDGDSIILKSGRAIDYYSTPGLPSIGSGFLHDAKTRTIFSGNIFGNLPGEWNLFAPANAWESPAPVNADAQDSKKALMRAFNKIERLSPDRLCLQLGPIIEDDIDSYIAAARKTDTDK